MLSLRRAAIRVLLSALFGLAPAALADSEDAQTYAKCLALARKDPAQGFETGEVWRAHGGGLPAEHCVALALIGLKQYDEAAKRLERLATEMVRESDALRAEVLSQAAEAWSEAGRVADAEAALTEALKLAPGNPDFLVNRAVAYAQRAQYRAAIDDLNKALAVAPRADAFAYRAAAWRYLGDLRQARLDADKSVRSDPSLPEAWLELGNVKRLTDDVAGARQGWLKVIELAPMSAAADAARDNLEMLDIHVDGVPPKPAK